MSGSVTLHGANGAPVGTTGNSYASAHAAMFQALTAEVGSSGINLLTGNTNIVVQNDFGTVGIVGTGDATQSSVILIGDGTNVAFVGGSASTTLVGGDGSASIIAGSGNTTIALGTGTDQVYLGSGSAAVSLAGANNFLQAGTGSASIVLTGTGATVDGSYASPLTIDDTQGTNSTLNVVNGSTINISQISTTTINAYGNATINGDAGGSAAVNQQTGVLRFVGSGASITVTGGPGAGSDTLYAAGGTTPTHITLVSNAADNVFVANDPTVGADGAAYFDGSAATGGNQFWAGSGNATLLGGSGGDTMVAGAGTSDMQGGGTTSTNYFDMLYATTSSSVMTVENFLQTDPNDKLTFFGYGASAAAQFIAGASSTASIVGLNGTESGLTYKFSNGATVNLVGVTKTELNLGNVLST